ncbi:MAG: hypothetical protein H0X40_01410 [Chthoniobacterales bacterium]|nr:hypothetical protein [Chthoniobacterales bacterium]
MKTAPGRLSGAYTLLEILITTAIMALVGGLIFYVLNSSMVLYAKNTAVNSAHQQARAGIDEMLTNVHSSVSIPELVDANLQAVNPIVDGFGNAISTVGVSFQVFNAGPFPVTLDAAANATSIVLYCPGYVPPAGARLNIPSHNIEYNITNTAALGSYRGFRLATPVTGIGTAVDVAGTGIEGQAGVNYVISAFITTRFSYAVVGSELRFYPTNDVNNYKVITRNIVNATPFSVPVLQNGGLQNRFLAAINLSTVEPQFTNRGYAAVNMFISSTIPFRCRLTNSQ